MKEQRFYHSINNRMVSTYRIYREGDTIYVENDNFPVSVEDQVTLGWKFFMHIGNVPEVVEAVGFVFKTPPGYGEYKHIKEFNEDVVVGMDTEMKISDLALYTNRQNEESGLLRFYFDRGQIAYEPEKRKPTPAMVWVMKELTKEYKAWEKEQKKK